MVVIADMINTICRAAITISDSSTNVKAIASLVIIGALFLVMICIIIPAFLANFCYNSDD